MKNWFSKKGNILTIVILVFVLWKQLPMLMAGLKMEGESIPSKEYPLINNPSSIVFPPQEGRAMAIFWATWCAPCKLEMERLQKSVEDGKIPGELIFAINPFEPSEVSREFIRKNKYPFIFIEAPEVAQKMNILATPTTLLLENQTIHSMSSGLSIIGIWKAESFL